MSNSYVMISGMWDHPLALKNGVVTEHSLVLWQTLGCESLDCAHTCHWGCGRILMWRKAGRGIQVDHLDENKSNNTPDNLVPSCSACNTQRNGKCQDQAIIGMANMDDASRERRRIGGQRGGLANRGKPKKRSPCARCGNSYSPSGLVNHRCNAR